MLKRIFALFLCLSLVFPGQAAWAEEALAAEDDAIDAELGIGGGFDKIKDSLASDLKNLPARTTAGVSEIHTIQWPTADGEKPEAITIFQSTSQILRFDRQLSRVAVSDTGVCDITTLGTQEVLIYCTRPGRINLLAWDMEYQIAIYDIQSVIDYKKLQEIILGIDPSAQIQILPYANTVAVQGSASTIEKVKKIEEAVKAYNERALSYVRVIRPKQILLEVRFAEIDRRANNDYGLDGELISRFITTRSFTGETHGGGTDAGSPFTAPGAVAAVEPLEAPDPDSSNEFFSYTDSGYKVQAFLRWLQQKNILKLTARPNLLALDGEEANFVVGGESPYITSSQTTTNVAFKEFGTKLAFKPTVMDNEQIRLQMRVEVSELDFSTTVSLQGTVVPTLVKTTHQTVAELGDNETIVVGGLVNQRINRVEKKVPFFGSLPGLEKLFSRTEYERKDVELLIVCTPHLIEPFENPDKKDLYPPKEVIEATGMYVPAYPDLHGDMINRLLIQQERYHDFDGFAHKRAKEIEEEFVRIKKRETLMEKALRKATGFKLIEEIDPLPPEPAPLEDSDLFTATLEDTPLEENPLDEVTTETSGFDAAAAPPTTPVSNLS
jgi:pilus assembly protein CpaC